MYPFFIIKQCHEILAWSNNEPLLLPSSHRVNKWRSLARRILNSSFTTAGCCSGKRALDAQSERVSPEELGCSTGFMGNEITAAIPHFLIAFPVPEQDLDSCKRPDQTATSLPAGSLHRDPEETEPCVLSFSPSSPVRESHTCFPKQTLIRAGDKGQDIESC